MTAWYPNRRPLAETFDPKHPNASSGVANAKLAESTEEKLFLTETQFVVGLLDALAEQNFKSAGPSMKKTVDEIRNGFYRGYIESIDKGLVGVAESGEQAQAAVTNFDRKRLIVAVRFHAANSIDKLCYRLLNSHEPGGAPDPVDQILLRSCSNFDAPVADTPGVQPPAVNPSAEAPLVPAVPEEKSAAAASESTRPLTLEEYEALREKTGWFAGLYQMTFAGDDTPIGKETLATAWAATVTAIKIIVCICVLGIASLIFGSILFSKWVGGKLSYHFERSAVEPTLILETFALYLAAMLSTPTILRFLAGHGYSFNVLKVNLFAISALTLLVWWPRIWGAARKDVETTFGLDSKRIGESIRNVLAGPFCYIAAIVPLFFTIAIYSLVLQSFKVQTSEGAHPIIPILTETKDNSTIYMIIFMAVVIAPFVEEIMFRGVFYSWLRTHVSATAAILISSLVFAAVHPQGPIGVVPLTGIGIVLAFLREWRGSLVGSMAAHACFNAGTLALALNILR